MAMTRQYLILNQKEFLVLCEKLLFCFLQYCYISTHKDQSQSLYTHNQFFIKDEPERTQSVFRGDFYLTGDRAYRDDEGYFWFVGRSDDVINSSG